MLNLTEIIAKPVISLSEGTAIGTVENAVFDKKLKKLKFIVVFNENMEEKIYIPSNYILNAQNSAVIVKSNYVGDGTAVAENSPLKAPVYLHDGKISGRVTDIALSDSLEVLHIVKDENFNIEINNVISFSTDAVMVCMEEDKLGMLKKIKPQKAHVKKTAGISAEISARLSVAEPSAETTSAAGMPAIPSEGVSLQPAQEKKADEAEKSRNQDYYLRNIVPEFSYLIGRKTTENICNQNMKVIVPKNSVITQKHIDICRNFGKLIMLAKYSK